MSLINKMLRDLDARLAQPSAAPLPKEVRVLPKGIPKGRFGRGTWIFVALAAVAYALLQLSDFWLPTARNLFKASPATPAIVAVPVPPAAAIKTAPPAAPSQPASELPPVPVASPPAPASAPAAPMVTGKIASAAAPSPPVAEVPGAVRPPASPGPGAAAVVQPAPARTPRGTEAAANKADTSQQRTPPKRESPPSVSSRASEKNHAVAAPNVTRQTADPPPKIERDVAAADKIEQDYRKGVSAYQQGHPSEAAAQFKAILKETPRHLGARQTLLSMYAEQRQWEEAQKLLKEGLSILPTHIDWAMSLARIQAENGQTEEAWLTLQRHSAYAEERAEYQGFAGVLLQRLKRPSEATGRFRAAVRLKPGEGRWWLGLGTALEADGHATEAREAFVRARASEGLTPDMTAFLDKKLR